MLERTRQISEVFALRIVPGVLNLVAMMTIATWLTTANYGLMSTFVATSGAVADLAFGFLAQSAIAAHARFAGDGSGRHFEHQYFTTALLIATGVTAVGVVAVMLGLLSWAFIAAIAAFGFYTAIQEISHARLEFFRFALGSTVQSLSFLALVYLLVRPAPTIDNAVWAFSLSYALGGALSAILASVRLTVPNRQMLGHSFRVGMPAMLSNLATNAFTLGCRYLLLSFGALQALGVFSFSVDLAQRVVGIFISIAAFAIVPRTFKDNGNANIAKLRATLTKGAYATGAVALASTAAVLALATTNLVPALNKPAFVPLSFGLIALAQIINRTAKMALTPVAMQLQRSELLLRAILIVTPLGLAGCAALLAARVPLAVELSYLAAFILWFLLGNSFVSRAAVSHGRSAAARTHL